MVKCDQPQQNNLNDNTGCQAAGIEEIVMKKYQIALIAGACAIFMSGAASAQATWPSAPIKIIVPFPAGGTSDVIARLLGQKMTTAWGQPVVIENRTGASGNIGADLVAKSKPDGYTLLLMDMGNLTISPSLYPKLPFNPQTDLTPVTMVAYSPHLLVTANNVPVKTMSELVTYAKGHKDTLNFAAAAGTGSAAHLAGVLFAEKAGIQWGYIPYRGGAQALGDLVGGQVDVTLNGMVATYPHVKSGRVRLLAVSSAKRLPQLPDVPTIAETYPGFVTGSWQGLMAAEGTPRPVIDKIRAEVAKIIAMPDVKEKMDAQGAEAYTMTPEEYRGWMKTEVNRWAKVVKDANIKVD
jgi:tripartite-type tricarboxylate transporter receptor subunit TctC